MAAQHRRETIERAKAVAAIHRMGEAGKREPACPGVLLPEPWQDWDREFRAFLDEMPRKPFKFLQMVAANDKRREALAIVARRKAKNRERYERAYARRGKK